MSNIDDDFIIIYEEDLNPEYNSKKNINSSEIDPSLSEKHWNNKNISKSLNKWRKLRTYDLLLEIATSYIKKKQYCKAFKYWKNCLKKFTKLDISYDNNSFNNIIIKNKFNNINNIEKEESTLINKDSCIDSCIDLIFVNFVSPLKEFFNEITNYFQNFINSFKNN